jgi:hypothetical protein
MPVGTLGRVRRAVIAVVFAVLLVGCAQSGYDAPKLQSELQHAHLTPQQSRCVTDAMEQKFDIAQLGSHSAPTAGEEATTRDILVGCGVKLS